MNIKKIISSIIVVSMLMSFMPTILFAASDNGPSINWNFSKGISGWKLRAPGEGAKFEHKTSGGVGDSACVYVSKSQGAGDVISPFTFEGAKAGDVYTLSVNIKLAETGEATSKWAHMVNGSGSFVDPTGISVNSNGWTTVSATLIITSDNDSTKAGFPGIPYLRVSHGSTYNGGYYMDDFKITKVREGSFFPSDKRWEYEDGEEDDQGETEVTKVDNSIAEKLSQVVALKTGSSTVFARNNRIELGEGVNTIKVNGTIMIPVRTVADTLTMMVEWDSDNQEVIVYDAYYELTVGVGDFSASVLDFTTREKSGADLAVPAQIFNGTLYIPLDTFCNVFKKQSYITDDEVILIGETVISLTDDEEEKVLKFFTEDLKTVEFWVSLDGNDEGDGSKSSPFKTLEKAQLKARDYRDKNVVVNIKSGEYEITKMLKFTAEDSKIGMARTTFKGDGNVILNGGIKARGWEKCEEMNGVMGIYKHKIDDGMVYRYIYEDGVMAVQARYPNRDESNVANSYLTVDQEPYTKTGQNATGPRASFLYKATDNMPTLLKPENANVWIWPGGESGQWRWHFENHEVKDIDVSKKKVTLETQAGYTLGVGCAYYIANDKALLDYPGEFYIDEDEDYLYYYPRNAENLNDNIILPEAGGIINIDGASGDPVSGIGFENLSIRNSDHQDLICMQNARNISIENCRLYSSGDDAIEMKGYSQNNIIKGCEIFDVARHAVYGGNERIMYNRVENCYIHNVGVVEKDGHGVFFAVSRNNTIKNNTLHTGPRFLITVSGNGSEDVIKDGDINKIPSRNNLIAYNDISAGMQESQDGCSLYIFCSYRNILASNRIHNQEFVNTTKTDIMVGFGMYGDDCTYYTVNRNNLVDNNQVENESKDDTVGTMHYMIHQKGAGSLVENNYFVKANVKNAFFSSDSIGNDGRKHGNYYYNNIAYTGGTVATYNNVLAGDGQLTYKGTDNNIFYNPSGEYPVGTGGQSLVLTLDELRDYRDLDLDKNSLTEDPKFVNWENNDFRLRYDSPAYRLGTNDLNTKDVGVKADFKFADRDEELKWLYVRFDGDSLDKSYRRMNIGQNVKLNVTARTKTGMIANLDNAEIKYDTDNQNIASVSKDGIVTAVSNGIATITVTVAKNGKSLTLPMTVIVGDSVASLEIKNNVTRIVSGDEAQLDYVAFGLNGSASNRINVSYKSSNPNVIKVSEAGVMKAVSVGEANITVTATDGINTVSASKKFTSVDADIIELKFFCDNILKVGNDTICELWALKENGRMLNSGISLETSDNEVIRIDGNKIIAVSAGKATVKASIDYYGKKVTVTKNIFVIAKDANIEDYGMAEYIGPSGSTEIAFYDKSQKKLINNSDFSGDMPMLRTSGFRYADENKIFDNWWIKRPEIASIDKTAGINGSPCVKILGIGGDADVLQNIPALEPSVMRGKRFVMKAKVRLIDGSGTGRFICVYRHGYPDQVGYWVSAESTPLSTEWQTVTTVFEYNEAMGGIGIPDVALRIAGNSSGYYLDDFELFEAIN